MAKDDVRLLQGTLELLIMESLGDGDARHGFDVLRWISSATRGALTIEEGALYPALHRMEGRGWLAGEWGVSSNNRNAKYYTLTRAGRKQLAAEEAAWRRYTDVMKAVLTARTAAGGAT